MQSLFFLISTWTQETKDKYCHSELPSIKSLHQRKKYFLYYFLNFTVLYNQCKDFGNSFFSFSFSFSNISLHHHSTPDAGFVACSMYIKKKIKKKTLGKQKTMGKRKNNTPISQFSLKLLLQNEYVLHWGPMLLLGNLLWDMVWNFTVKRIQATTIFQ